MPGFSAECVSGAHEACVERDCRCEHHSWTQELLKKSNQKNVGARRGRKSPSVIEIPSEPVAEATCPQCGAKAKATDNFCRKDGTKLLVGQMCLRCGAAGETGDEFCFACGWKHGEPPPAAPPPLTREEQIARLKTMAEERGIDPSRVEQLLKETVVS